MLSKTHTSFAEMSLAFKRKPILLVKANSHACLLQRIRPYGRGVERLTLRLTIDTLDYRGAFDLFDRGVEWLVLGATIFLSQRVLGFLS